MRTNRFVKGVDIESIGGGAIDIGVVVVIRISQTWTVLDKVFFLQLPWSKVSLISSLVIPLYVM